MLKHCQMRSRPQTLFSGKNCWNVKEILFDGRAGTARSAVVCKIIISSTLVQRKDLTQVCVVLLCNHLFTLEYTSIYLKTYPKLYRNSLMYFILSAQQKWRKKMQRNKNWRRLIKWSGKGSCIIVNDLSITSHEIIWKRTRTHLSVTTYRLLWF